MRFQIWALGVALFILLGARFAPNWIAFGREYRTVMEQAPDAAHRTAVRTSFLETIPTTRGVFVVQQAANLNTEIADPNHKIVRWRLLMPALGHVLRLPSFVLLGLAPVGGLFLLIAFISLGRELASDSRHPWLQAASLAIVAGATAPLITSMGWLGYYDVWLALALVGVAFTQTRWIIILTCVAAPWLDERFVLGLPLALCARWAWFDPPREKMRAWFKREALPPLALVVLFALVRLQLGGSGGSQTVEDYLRSFVLGRDVTATRLLQGAWEGLRLGWLPVLMIVAVAAGALRQNGGRDFRLVAVVTAAAITACVGLFMALDLSRSMVLLVPLVPLGWRLASRFSWWRAAPGATALAIAALLIPAHHVVSRFVLPVENVWSGPSNRPEVYTHLASIYATGKGGPQDPAEALRWYRKAAEIGTAENQFNLGLALELGNGVPKDFAEAAHWYRRAADRGFARAQANLGSFYARGAGVTQDNTEAGKWFRRAADQGDAVAQSNLAGLLLKGEGTARDPAAAVSFYRKSADHGYAPAQATLGSLYATGTGVAPDPALAIKWLSAAAAQGFPEAELNLGVLYANGTGVAKDPIEALAWFDLAAAAHHPDGIKYRDYLGGQLTPSQVRAARQRSAELLK